MNADRSIPVSGPSITQKEIDYVCDAVRCAWYDRANTYNDRFETAFAAHIGTKYAISLPSCTSAIHLALLSRNVGPGDEVIVPDITWIATAAPICYVGATPVFADIDERTWCLSPESFAMHVTNKTKAVIPVHLYGNMADMDRIRQIAAAYDIAVIEDAAEAIGSEYKGSKSGSLGHAGVFSFHGSKTMTTGEGGMLVTNSEDIYRRALVLRDHGRLPGDTMFRNEEVAYKYKMSSLQAALGLAQLERIEELVAMKREIFAWYLEELGSIPGVTLNPDSPDVRNSYWMVTALVDAKYGIDKEAMIRLLAGKHIHSRPFFHPLSSLSAFRHLPQAVRAQESNVNSYAISPYAFNLPSGLTMTRETVHYVCKTLRSILDV
ncbi:DegT/DnrJ/EryC1/StrS family aminotransferase [Paenibacillus cymbidii]|uniref:DegT/DnrJ/EryC1/StrS family aminotransferase n=1 Tax=Paenibacillus cymbidii TaxID=1639034 RepID=UPI001081B004|nr:DegT/DnrJ/EryC1/StrS family aminotransferase [Paenibacillus cymbidii]